MNRIIYLEALSLNQPVEVFDNSVIGNISVDSSFSIHALVNAVATDLVNTLKIQIQFIVNILCRCSVFDIHKKMGQLQVIDLSLKSPLIVKIYTKLNRG